MKRFLFSLVLVAFFTWAGWFITRVLFISQWPEEGSLLVRLQSADYMDYVEDTEAETTEKESDEENPRQWETERVDVVMQVVSGGDAGKYVSLVVEQLKNGSPPLVKGKEYILLVDFFEDGAVQYYISDSFRAPWVAAMVCAAMGILVASAGTAGLRALAGLLGSLGVLFWIYIPLLKEGAPPVPYALAVVVGVVAITVALVVRRKYWWPVAFLGALGGAGAASFLGWLMVVLWQLTGLAGEGGALLASTMPGLSLQGILLGAVIIGSVGAVLDVAISITSTMGELVNHDPNISSITLWKAGVGSGREVLGSMINTLVLAYVGSSLPFILLISTSGTTLRGFLNNPSIAEELVRSLAGTTGLLLTVPATAFFGALWYGRHRKL